MERSMPVDITGERQGSLPPHVEGKVSGYLSMTVDSIKWHDKSHGMVRVYISWWGEKHKVMFIPQEVQNFTVKPCTSPQTTYVYCVMTNVEQFIAYLEDCEELNFHVSKHDLDFPVGKATLTSLSSIILLNPFKTSCVVIDKDGCEVADLTVSFMFYHSASSHKNFVSMEKLSQSYPDRKYHNDEKKKMVYKDDTKKPNDICSNESADIVSNSSISELLEQSQNIRQEYHTCGSPGLRFTRRRQGKSACPQPKIMSYLLGKDLSKEDELVALEAIRTTSPLPELLHQCGICIRHKENVKADKRISVKHQKCQNMFPVVGGTSEKFGKQMKESENKERKNEVVLKQSPSFLLNPRKEECLARYTRFLRLTIQTLSLNYVGMQRVLVSSRLPTSRTCNNSRMHQLPPGVVYFVEYEIPQYLNVRSGETQKTRKPWNCNLFRLCSRQRAGKCIHFYRQMIHMLACHKPGFTELLCNSSITFKIYSRHLNQRLPSLVGEASLCLGNVVKSYAFSALQELSIHPYAKGNPRHTLSLGTLKVKVEFSTNRTCFGTRLVECIMPESSVSSSESNSECEDYKTHSFNLHMKDSKLFEKEQNKQTYKKNTLGTCGASRRNHFRERFQNGKKIQTKTRTCETGNNTKKEKILLFGLLHVSDGRELKSDSTYLVSHGFWKEDVMTSDVCWHTKHPHFKFHKIMPVLLSLEFLDRCYNNFMVVETWSQGGLIGIAKLPLNQFYIAYRDPAVVEQLLLSKYPITGVDGWIDVIDPVSQHHVGQLNVVLALGTENQIQMLEVSRCLKEDLVNTQILSQSLSVESDCILGRSSAQLNNSTKSDPLLKFRMTDDCDTLVDSVFIDRFEKFSSQHLHGKTAQSLLASQCSDSKVSLLKLTINNPDEEVDVSEQNVLTLSPQRLQHINAEHCGNSCSGSSVTSKKESKEYNGTYRASGSVCCNEGSVSKLCLCIIPDVKHQGTNNFCTCQAQICTNSCAHLKCSETGNSSRHTESDSQKCLNEKLISIPESLLSDVGERDKQLLGIDNQIIEKDADVMSSDNDVIVKEIVNESFILNSIHNSIDNYSSDCDILLPNNCLPEQSLISRNEQQIETHELENFTHQVKSDENFLDQSPCNVMPTILDETIQSHIYLAPQKMNDLNDDESHKANDSFGLTVATENTCTQTDTSCSEIFLSLIEITNALYVSKLDNDQLPNCYVTIHTASNLLLSTPVVHNNTEPVWNWSGEVWLPATLLENSAKRLVLKVWHKKNKQTEHPNPIEDLVIGFVTLDLKVLAFGLPCISGWFNINNFNGICEGHIQVSVTPLQNISKFQNKWISPKLESKVADQEHGGNISIELCEAPVKYFMSSLLEKCIEIIPQEEERTKMNKAMSLNQKGVQNFSVPPDKRLGKLCIVEKMCRNLEETSDVLKNPCTNVDSFKSILNDVSLNYANQIKTVCHENQKLDTLDDSAMLNCDTSFIYAGQQETKHSHRTHNVCLSYFTDTLRKKFHELDEVMQQMKDRSEYKGIKVVEGQLLSDTKTIQESNRVHSINHVLSHNQSDSNVSQEVKLGHNIFLPKQDHDMFCNQQLYSKHGSVKERSVTNQFQKNGASYSLFHSQHADNVNDDVQVSSLEVPSSCNRANSNANNETYERVEDLRSHSSEEFCDDILSYTDHLMSEALSDMELENIFNPMLFQHIVAHHQCQKCCSEHSRRTNERAYSLHTKQSVTPSTSKTNFVKFPQKFHNYAKISSKISDENPSPYVPDRTEIKRLCGTRFFIDHLFHKLKATTDAIENKDEVFDFAACNRTPEPCNATKKLVPEYLSLSNCSEMENICLNLNSNEEKTKKNATMLDQFVPSNIEKRNDSELFGTRKNTLACDIRCSCNNTSEFVKQPLDITVESLDEKILNNVIINNKRRERKLKKNSSPCSNSLKTVNVEDCSSVAISDETIVLDSTKDMLQKSGSESSLLKLKIDRLDSNTCARGEQDKENASNDGNFREYPVMLNEIEMMRLVKILNKK